MIMPNGTVLPYGLLEAQGAEHAMAAFNRSYRNTGIKAGLVSNSYAANDSRNVSGLCTEYDIIVMEQNEDKGSTPITYKNCMSSQGFGSIADYFEYTLRPKTFQTNKGFPTFSNQDGAIALIQCLDNVGEKALVIGNLIHPNRPTNITSTAPQLFWEYNGIGITINIDGSFSLTFQGATNSKGVPTDATQGNTVFQIKPDGSFEFKHSTVDISANRSGILNITTKSDTNITAGGNTNVTTSGNTNLTTTGKTVVLSKEIDLNIKTPVSGNGLITSNSSGGVVDYITGVPLIPSTTTFGDV